MKKNIDTKKEAMTKPMTAKSKPVLRFFNIPTLGMNVEAENMADAIKKAKSKLTKQK